MLGILSMKALIFASASMRATLKDLYKESKVRSVDVNTPVEEVMRIMKKYDLVVLPVLDEEKKLVGRITIDDVVDLMQEVSDRDYQLASGISEDVESSDSIWTLTRARLPWLLIGMIGGMSGAYIIGVFDITEYPAMAVFMPLIAATGGNVGVQSAALVVRALANQSAFDETVWQKLVKEFGVGLLNAAVCSALIFLASQLFHFELLLSLTVSLALFCVIIFASLSGTFFPLMLDKLKIDPALATGPFVTTANDIVGLIIYFSVGHYFLTHFTSLPHSLF
jgi:magnesium transporter